MIRQLVVTLLMILFWTPVVGQRQSLTPTRRVRAAISFTRDVSSTPVDGRVFLLISKDNEREPRFEIEEDETKSQQIFGVDVDNLAPETAVLVDGSVLGYPLRSLDEIPAGNYYAQALLNRYTTFHRSDGYIVKQFSSACAK